MFQELEYTTYESEVSGTLSLSCFQQDLPSPGRSSGPYCTSTLAS